MFFPLGSADPPKCSGSVHVGLLSKMDEFSGERELLLLQPLISSVLSLLPSDGGLSHPDTPAVFYNTVWCMCCIVSGVVWLFCVFFCHLREYK